MSDEEPVVPTLAVRCDRCGGKCASPHAFCVLLKNKPHDHRVQHYCVFCAYELSSPKRAS